MRYVETSFELVAGHVVCELDCERVLIDTGSPVSFGRALTITVVETERELQPSLGDLTIDRVVEHIKALPAARSLPPDWTLDALVGADLLWGHTVVIDWDDRILRISAPDGEPARAPADPLARLVRTRLTVGDAELDAVVDTGAGVSYAVPAALGDVAPSGVADDFLPGAGHFEVATHSVFTAYLGVGFPGRIAAANDGVLHLMEAAGVEAIVGTDLLAHMGTSVFDYTGATAPTAVGEPRPGRPPELKRSKDFPYVVIRFMAAVYGKRKVRFVRPGQREGERFTSMRVEVAEPTPPGQPISAAERAALIERVREDVRAKRCRMCCVFGPNDSVYCEEDGSTRAHTEAPSGGARLDDVEVQRAKDLPGDGN